jgi:Tol biopolymer transport system component
MGLSDLSSDGRRALIDRIGPGGSDVWTVDLERGVGTRFTSRPGLNLGGVWSGDGRWVAFTSSGPFNLFVKEASGARVEEQLTHSKNTQFASDWSRDGRFILYQEDRADDGKWSIWSVPMYPERGKPIPYSPNSFNQYNARFSPDTRWVVFQSDESGKFEIYIDSFPESRGKIRISTGGGMLPRWTSNGREVYYVSADSKLMSVKLDLVDGVFRPSGPQALFPVHVTDSGADPLIASPDGKRFLMMQWSDKISPLRMIVNWPALLKGD